MINYRTQDIHNCKVASIKDVATMANAMYDYVVGKIGLGKSANDFFDTLSSYGKQDLRFIVPDDWRHRSVRASSDAFTKYLFNDRTTGMAEAYK